MNIMLQNTRAAGILFLLLLYTCFASAQQAASVNQKSITVIFHESARAITLAPGQEQIIATPCSQDEAVVGGGPTNIPASLTITFSTLFVSGGISGWEVNFRNNGSESVIETPQVGALCVRGRLVAAADAK